MFEQVGYKTKAAAGCRLYSSDNASASVTWAGKRRAMVSKANVQAVADGRGRRKILVKTRKPSWSLFFTTVVFVQMRKPREANPGVIAFIQRQPGMPWNKRWGYVTQHATRLKRYLFFMHCSLRRRNQIFRYRGVGENMTHG